MAMTVKILNIAWVYKFREQLLYTYSCLLVHMNTAFKFTCDERQGVEENTNVGWGMKISTWEDEYIDIVCVILFLCDFSKSRDWNLWLRWWVNVIRHVLNHFSYTIWLYFPYLCRWSLMLSIPTTLLKSFSQDGGHKQMHRCFSWLWPPFWNVCFYNVVSILNRACTLNKSQIAYGWCK